MTVQHPSATINRRTPGFSQTSSKSATIRRALSDPHVACMSDRRVAGLTGASHTLVARVRREMGGNDATVIRGSCRPEVREAAIRRRISELRAEADRLEATLPIQR
jgi:hypothetical protein